MLGESEHQGSEAKIRDEEKIRSLFELSKRKSSSSYFQKSWGVGGSTSYARSDSNKEKIDLDGTKKNTDNKLLTMQNKSY